MRGIGRGKTGKENRAGQIGARKTGGENRVREMGQEKLVLENRAGQIGYEKRGRGNRAVSVVLNSILSAKQNMKSGEANRACKSGRRPDLQHPISRARFQNGPIFL